MNFIHNHINQVFFENKYVDKFELSQYLLKLNSLRIEKLTSFFKLIMTIDSENIWVLLKKDLIEHDAPDNVIESIDYCISSEDARKIGIDICPNRSMVERSLMKIAEQLTIFCPYPSFSLPTFSESSLFSHKLKIDQVDFDINGNYQGIYHECLSSKLKVYNIEYLPPRILGSFSPIINKNKILPLKIVGTIENMNIIYLPDFLSIRSHFNWGEFINLTYEDIYFRDNQPLRYSMTNDYYDNIIQCMVWYLNKYYIFKVKLDKYYFTYEDVEYLLRDNDFIQLMLKYNIPTNKIQYHDLILTDNEGINLGVISNKIFDIEYKIL